eukprot:CAMPEP_0194416188 /NCGR_PEP_ID=MMETSP0176-20130528/15124_1 /TAXON_ID=216777 /ORGANISM="Proboscia alata, Strain PI-D3" /LENGTH=195 /DNA_ID=CAMNT_0039221353 /DNA_START=56 /DNA_END=639 /DNA_ORIENTATION=-
MGGKIAKERRRLKRQELRQTQTQIKQPSTPSDQVTATPVAQLSSSQSDPPPRPGARGSVAGAGAGAGAGADRTTTSGRNNKSSRPNATKPKKAKHLKRKRQQLEPKVVSKSKLERATTPVETDDSKSNNEPDEPKNIVAQIEAERAKLLNEMELSQKRKLKQKRKLVKSFERRVRNAAGDGFDEEIFNTLREKGA